MLDLGGSEPRRMASMWGERCIMLCYTIAKRFLVATTICVLVVGLALAGLIALL
jgi:hypothetical protein